MRPLLTVVISLLVALTVFGLVYRPSSTGPDFIDPVKVALSPICSEQPVPCINDSDCQHCRDANVFEMKCEGLDDRRYCLPTKPEQPCNEKLGGVWTWSGWADTRNKEWECLCTYPEIAGNRGCTKLNPNVCRGGTYTYKPSMDRGPLPSDCKCPRNTVQVVTEGDVPMCIARNKGSCFDEATCKRFYKSQ